ncbi:SDR family oxidoreductase [Puniceicoccaceae bacterium K14]|nr:SDR family oxidoreductase [Puniceicoccaceae bacterium K14]
MAERKVVFITGCSSGIGYELLKLFNTAQYNVVGTALPKSSDALSADPIAQADNIQIESLDVKDFQAASTLITKTEQRFGKIDILINNAGISYRSVVEDMTPEDEQNQLAVNYLGAMHLIRCVLPTMRKRRSGRIINISSVGGMMAMPTMASYSASKFALEGATESLWYETKPWNIHVSLVRPGFINSLAFEKVYYSSKRTSNQSEPSPYEEHYQNMTKFVGKMMKRTPCTSETVAKRIFQVAQRKRPPLRTAGTPDARIFYIIRRLIPRRLYHILLYRSLPGIKRWGK